ncbi:MAG: tetratricopeptide repeat protein, partial [Chloroflexi bacterium]|nr:tetratricopeptide repeat protein [Chloroflexota bacterium]
HQQEADQTFADAEAAYKRSIEIQPENYIARNYLADFYIQRNQLQQAIRQLQLSLRFNPNQPQVTKALQQLGSTP